jgi:hypothetical protein
VCENLSWRILNSFFRMTYSEDSLDTFTFLSER